MKNIYFGVVIIAMLLGSCSSDDDFRENNNGSTQTFVTPLTITVSDDSSEGTRATVSETGKSTWNEDDKIIVWADGSDSEFDMVSSSGKHAVFSGAVTSDSPLTDVTKLYAYVKSSVITHSGSSITVDLSMQTGKAEDALDYDLMWGTCTYGSPRITFGHTMAVMKYTLNLTGAGTQTADIRLSGNGMANKVTFNATTGIGNAVPTQAGVTATNMELGDITLTNVQVTDGKAVVYVSLYPSTFTEMQAFITLADGKKATASVGYSSTYPLTYTLAAKKFYTASATVRPVTAAKVGYFYNSDGSYTSNAQSNTIGVVFSNETSARDFQAGYTHGYVMALQNVGGENQRYTWDNQNMGHTYASEGYPCLLANAWYYDRDGLFETKLLATLANGRGNAAKAAYNTYKNTVSAPNSSSGWYLPANGQWYDILVNLGGMKMDKTQGLNYSLTDNSLWNRWWTKDGQWTGSYAEQAQNALNTLLNAAKSAGSTVHTLNTTSGSFEWFWASSEYRSERNAIRARRTNFYSNDGGLYIDHGAKNDHGMVRPVLAF